MHRLFLLHALLSHLPHLREGQRFALEIGVWALAVVWTVRTRSLMRRLDQVPDLSSDRWDLCPVRAPGVVVILPVRNEAETLRPTTETLLAQDYPWLRVIAVDDRSTDDTGAVLEELCRSAPDRLSVLHVTDPSEGWIAQTFAMESAGVISQSQWLLFTQAEVWFSPSLVRRALSFAESAGVDHLSVQATPVSAHWRARAVRSFLAVLSLWALPPWMQTSSTPRWLAAPAAEFSLLRRETWEELGGFGPQRLALRADLALGCRVHAAGLRHRTVFAPGLLLARHRVGFFGIPRATTRDGFALFDFRLLPLLAAIGSIAVFFAVPVAALLWPASLLPATIGLACIGVHYRELAERNGLEVRWFWLYPVAAALMILSLLRAAALAGWRGGVRWKGELYLLRSLRGNNNLLAWGWAASQERAEGRLRARRFRVQNGAWIRRLRSVRKRDASTHPKRFF